MAFEVSDVPSPRLAPNIYAGFVPDRSNSELNAYPQRILVIGTVPPTSRAPDGVHEVSDSADIDTVYGEGSDLAEMLHAAFDVAKFIPIFALAIKGGASVKAAWEFRFSKSAAIKDGEVVVGCCSRQPYKVSLKVAQLVQEGSDSGKLACEAVASALREATEFPYSVSTSGSSLVLEEPSLSANSNPMHLGIESHVPGLEVKRTRFVPGVYVPGDIKALLDQLPQEQYTQVALGASDPQSIQAIDDVLEERWGSVEQLDGHCFVALPGNLEKVLSSYAQLSNLKHVTIMPTSDSTTPAHVWAAVLAGVNAKYVSKPYLPYTGLLLPGVEAPRNPFTLQNRNRLLQEGLSTFTADGKRVRIGRLVSYYTEDNSYRDVNKKQILSYLRFDLVKYLRAKLKRTALSLDESQADEEVTTPKSMCNEIIARHLMWKKGKYVQDPDGSFKDRVQVYADSQDGEWFKVAVPVFTMRQLRGMVLTFAFRV